MHRVLTWLLATSALLIVSHAYAAPAHDWSYAYGGAGMNNPSDVAVDAAGNVVLAGTFTGSMNLGGGPLASAGQYDIFLAKFDPTGAHMWSKRFGSTGIDGAAGLAVDAAGNIAITGNFQGSVSFGAAALTSKGGDDIYVAKFDAAGNPLWSRGYGTIGDDEGRDLVADASNHLIVTGHYGRAIDFGGGVTPFVGSVDFFLLKLDANGAYQWSRVAGSNNIDEGDGVAVDASGNIAVTGSFFNTVSFGGSSLVSAGLGDAFVAKYAADGTHLWSTRLGFSGITDSGQGVAIDAGANDIFFAVFDAAGVHDWSQRFGNTLDDLGAACTFDPSSALVATGSFSSSLNFGGGMLVSLGNADAYLVKFGNPVAVDTTPPVITCPSDIVVEQTGSNGTPATNAAIAAFLSAATASDDVDPAPVITHNAPAMFPPGTTPVTFRATDASGNHAECTAHVTVSDTTPPQIAVTLDKTLLWPPNHKFVTVCAQVSVSDNAGTPSWSLVSITSDEAPDSTGDGHTPQDFRDATFGTADRCVDLRAERAGSGDGRVYTLVYSARDASGNLATATAHVRVPHDMSSLGDSEEGGALTSVHPNPFNPETTVEYFLADAHHVRIDIYDARGALVRRLVDEGTPAGSHRVVWNGVDDAGRAVSSGIYFVKLTANLRTETRKIVMLK